MKSARHAMVSRSILRSCITLSLCGLCIAVPAQSQDAEVTPQVQQLYAQAQAALEHAGGYAWRDRALATLHGLGFRDDACSAQYIVHCTRTHKSTISRAVTALMTRQIIERIENEDDRREYSLRLTRKGKALYDELIPRLLRKEQEILSCLSPRERKDFAVMLGKIEHSLDLVQTNDEANEAGY